MRPLQRRSVNKGRSAKQFSRSQRFTKQANVAPQVMRGGWRL